MRVNTMSNKSYSGGVGFGGCFVFIISMILLWALLAGVNIGGKHYGITCGDKGVDVQTGGK
jgi:hypothetical protein